MTPFVGTEHLKSGDVAILTARDGGIFRFDNQSLRVLIKNLKRGNIDISVEQMALKALEGGSE